MASAQMVRTGTWNQMFPTDQTTEVQSASFVKKLLAVAISNIAYLRAIFPEGAFGDRSLEDLNLKILKDESSCPGACQVVQWIRGCFDALDKKYLRMLVMGIYADPNDPETVMESYTFKFSYTQNGGIDIYRNEKKLAAAHTKAETKKATIRLLHTIIVLTQSLKSLPDDVMMTMKLLYYDEVTPEDYEPPGFVSCGSDTFTFEEEPATIKVGDVHTAFHAVKLRIKTDAKQFHEPEQANERDSEDEVLEVEEEEMDLNLSQTQNEGEESTGDKINDQAVPDPCKKSLQDLGAGDGAHNNTPQLSEKEEEENGVRCACGCNEDDGIMILCDLCKFWQHGVCFLILHEDEAPACHLCHICAKPDQPDKATDPTLSSQSEIAQQATCLWRRTLLACKEMKNVVATSLSRRLGTELMVANGLFKRLEKEGFIKPPSKGKKLGKVVDKEKLEDGIKKYCRAKEESVVEETGEEMTKEKQLESQIDGLTDAAKNLDVSGKWKKPTEEQKNPARGKKRVKLDSEDYEFDISDSQDVGSQYVEVDTGKQRKKRKTSQVKQPIPI